MKVFDLIGINPTKGELITYVAKTGDGRTSVLIKTACELANDGKKVLFITEEMTGGELMDKCSPLITNEEAQLTIYNTHYPIEAIDELFNDTSYDVVFLDGYFGNKVDFRLVARKYDTLIINTLQANRDGSIKTDSRPIAMADCVLSITRINGSLTLKDKLRNFFLFWKPKKVAPNAHLRVLKNRYGKASSTDVNIDFKTLEIKK